MAMKRNAFRVGDWVVVRKTKHSVHPGPRATNIAPAQHGDLYDYTVDKFWVVTGLPAPDMLLVVTPGGKQHTLPATALNLRRASFWERLLHRQRFLAAEAFANKLQAAGTCSSDRNSANSPAPLETVN